MKKEVKTLSEIDMLGKTPQDYIDEIKAGRADTIAGIRRMAVAYDELTRRFSNAEQLIKKDPQLCWLSKETCAKLRMIAKNDLDPRVIMIPDRVLSEDLASLPYVKQQEILDRNPKFPVIDAATGIVEDVAYIDTVPSKRKIMWDHCKMRIRTPSEQRDVIAKMKAAKQKAVESIRPYRRIGNVVRFEKCEIGRNELAELCRQMGFSVTESK